MQHEQVLKKLNFDLLTPKVSGGDLRAKIFSTMLLHFLILFNLICNMSMFDLFDMILYVP